MIDYYCDLFSFVFCLFVCLSLTNERISLIVDLFLLLSRHCCCISFLPSLMVIVRSFVFFFSLFVPLASCFKCSKKKWKKENCNKNNNNNTKKKRSRRRRKTYFRWIWPILLSGVACCSCAQCCCCCYDSASFRIATCLRECMWMFVHIFVVMRQKRVESLPDDFTWVQFHFKHRTVKLDTL